MYSRDTVLYVGAKIRMKRRMAGMTIARLGYACGICVEMLKDLEVGSDSVSWSDLARIAGALGCEPSEFFDGLEDL